MLSHEAFHETPLVSINSPFVILWVATDLKLSVKMATLLKASLFSTVKYLSNAPIKLCALARIELNTTRKNVL
jgi:hypothetical protein